MSHPQNTVNHRKCCRTSCSYAQISHRKDPARLPVPGTQVRGQGRSGRVEGKVARPQVQCNALHHLPIAVQHQQLFLLPCFTPGHCTAAQRGLPFTSTTVETSAWSSCLLVSLICTQDWSEQAAGVHMQSSAESYPVMQVCTAD